MTTLPPFERSRYAPVVDHPGPFVVFDFTETYDPATIETSGWGIGRYDEVRSRGMYNSQLYDDGRRVHMGLDIWGPAGTPVRAFYPGVVRAVADNDHPRDYGPTIVTQHEIDGVDVWALHGHLCRRSLTRLTPGHSFDAGDVIGYFGEHDVNGGWAPHLHFQLALADPGEANMPGVVHPDERFAARSLYPDPRVVLGPLY